VKRSGRDEPMWIAILKCMEAMLGICLYSYLYLKLAKLLCLYYYLLCFLFNIIAEGRTGSAWKPGEWEGEGRGGGAEEEMVQTMYAHMNK
jgi:hypothetical protein